MFEGLSLQSYPDPGTGGAPWTIGYGHTGGDVRPGESISSSVAEVFLAGDLAKAAASVSRLITAPLDQGPFDALTSFAFNVGAGALEGSTLRRRLNQGEPVLQVLEQELPRWCKGGDPARVIEGLSKRRAAEVDHARQGTTAAPRQQSPAPRPSWGPQGISGVVADGFSLKRAAANHEGLPWQDGAWDRLQSSLTPQQFRAFRDGFRQGPPPSVPSPAPAPVPAPAPAPPAALRLEVPYLFQLDSATTEGSRMCFSSTCAMLAAYLKPGSLQGAGQADDRFLAIVKQFGDTTDAGAQVRALGSLGIVARFRQDGGIVDLQRQLAAGFPVPVGWLHKGGASPSGGHWSLIVGEDRAAKALTVHDPFGEADLVRGGYVSNAPTAGRFATYSERNWGRRWMVEGPSSGWWIEVLRVA